MNKKRIVAFILAIAMIISGIHLSSSNVNAAGNKSGTPGDMIADLEVNVKDLVRLKNLIKNGDVSSSSDSFNATGDINDDLQNDVSDIEGLHNLLIGQYEDTIEGLLTSGAKKIASGEVSTTDLTLVGTEFREDFNSVEAENNFASTGSATVSVNNGVLTVTKTAQWQGLRGQNFKFSGGATYKFSFDLCVNNMGSTDYFEVVFADGTANKVNHSLASYVKVGKTVRVSFEITLLEDATEFLIGCWDGGAVYTLDNFSIKNIDGDASSGEISEVVGLTDCTNVGVDFDRFENEELLTIVESDYDIVLNGVDYGIAANDSQDDSTALYAALEKVKEYVDNNKSVLLKLPKGELNLINSSAADSSCAVLISGLKNVCVYGENTIFMLHDVKIGVKIRNCENLSIKGISYDYERTPFSVGTVTASTTTSVTVAFPEHYPITQDMEFCSYLEYDKDAKIPRKNGNFLRKFNRVSVNGQNVTFSFSTTINQPDSGTLVVTPHYIYNYNAFDIDSCVNVQLENIDVYTTAGMGLVCINSKNIDVNRFNVKLKPHTDRLMSATADGMHFGGCRGTINITNCLIENTHDDACNVKSGHYMGLADINTVSNTLTFTNLTYMHRIDKGDVFYVYRKNLEKVAEVEVAEVLATDASSTSVKVKSMPSIVTSDMIVANATTAAETCFENNIVRNKRNRGILLQTKDSVVRNNAFLSVGHGAIAIMSEAGDFNEAIAPENVIVENNKIIECNDMDKLVSGDINVLAYSTDMVDAPVGTMKSLIIRNNFIGNVSKKAINVGSAIDSKVVNNCIYNPATNPLKSENNCAISVVESENIEIAKNCVHKEQYSAEYQSLMSNGTVSEESITVADNEGLDFGNVYTGSTIDLTNAGAKFKLDFDDSSSLQYVAANNSNISLIENGEGNALQIEKAGYWQGLNFSNMKFAASGLYKISMKVKSISGNPESSWVTMSSAANGSYQDVGAQMGMTSDWTEFSNYYTLKEFEDYFLNLSIQNNSCIFAIDDVLIEHVDVVDLSTKGSVYEEKFDSTMAERHFASAGHATVGVKEGVLSVTKTAQWQGLKGQNFKFKKGETYRFSFDLNVSNMGSTDYFEVVFADGTANKVSHSLASYVKVGEVVNVSFDITLLGDATEFLIGCWDGGAVYTIDNFKIENVLEIIDLTEAGAIYTDSFDGTASDYFASTGHAAVEVKDGALSVTKTAQWQGLKGQNFKFARGNTYKFTFDLNVSSMSSTDYFELVFADGTANKVSHSLASYVKEGETVNISFAVTLLDDATEFMIGCWDGGAIYTIDNLTITNKS